MLSWNLCVSTSPAAVGKFMWLYVVIRENHRRKSATVCFFLLFLRHQPFPVPSRRQPLVMGCWHQLSASCWRDVTLNHCQGLVPTDKTEASRRYRTFLYWERKGVRRRREWKKKPIAGRQPDEDGPLVYPTNAFDSRLRGDQVPLGSSPTKSQKKKKDRTCRSLRTSLQLHHDQHQDLRCVRCYARRLGDSRRNAHAKAQAALEPGLRQTSHAIVWPLRPPFLSFSLPPK